MTRVFLLLACGMPTLFLACSRTERPTTGPSGEAAPAKSVDGKPWFVDVTAKAGIDFVHYDASTPTRYISEVMGSGVAFIDYDGDGWIDVFCVQDGPVLPDKSQPQPTHRLYHNNRNGTFTDVTAQVGLDKSGMGMGCAVGDYDNDGFDDLVITYFDKISLFHNEPDGKGGRHFVDVTAASKLSNTKWGTSCGWADIDGDGFLDLYVCNYVDLDLKNYKPCTTPDTNFPYTCPPTVFENVPHKLFHNNGDGTFTDISSGSGIASPRAGAGLGVALVDLDGDGKVDIYVANDMQAAFVLKNEGGGKFRDVSSISGASLMPNGRFMAGMGVAVGDIDHSGRPSILVSNYQDEPTMVFLNHGNMFFREWSHPSGLGPATTKTLGFGIDLLDADLDGNLDVALTNGHVVPKEGPRPAHVTYAQKSQFFVGDGRTHFHEVSETAGAFFQQQHVGRGLAVGDFDNDGRPDLLFGLNAGPVRLLRNETETQNHWLRLDLVGDGKKSNRNAIGAKVEIVAGGQKQTRFVIGGGSYLSASDRRVLVGLGPATAAQLIAVTWPSGVRQEYRDLAGDSAWSLEEGEASPKRAISGK